jgi:hypothetical protein
MKYYSLNEKEFKLDSDESKATFNIANMLFLVLACRGRKSLSTGFHGYYKDEKIHVRTDWYNLTQGSGWKVGPLRVATLKPKYIFLTEEIEVFEMKTVNTDIFGRKTDKNIFDYVSKFRNGSWVEHLENIIKEETRKVNTTETDFSPVD